MRKPSFFTTGVLFVALCAAACGGNVVVDTGKSTGTQGTGGNTASTGTGASTSTSNGGSSTTGSSGGPSDACGTNGPVNMAACLTAGAMCSAPMGQFCFMQWACTAGGTWSTSEECEGG